MKNENGSWSEYLLIPFFAPFVAIIYLVMISFVGLEWMGNNYHLWRGKLLLAVYTVAGILAFNYSTDVGNAWRKSVDDVYPTVGVVTTENRVYHRPYHYGSRNRIYKTSEALEMNLRGCNVCCPGGKNMKASMPPEIIRNPIFASIIAVFICSGIMGFIIFKNNEQNTPPVVEAIKNDDVLLIPSNEGPRPEAKVLLQKKFLQHSLSTNDQAAIANIERLLKREDFEKAYFQAYMLHFQKRDLRDRAIDMISMAQKMISSDKISEINKEINLSRKRKKKA